MFVLRGFLCLKKVKILLLRGCLKTMIKTLIYCASGTGERVAYSLDDERYEVIGLVDSNPEVWGKSLYGMGGYCRLVK